MRGESVFTEIIHEMRPPLSLWLSLLVSASALSAAPQASSLLLPLQPFHVEVRFKFPHQRGKPLIVPLNEALNPPAAPVELASIQQ